MYFAILCKKPRYLFIKKEKEGLENTDLFLRT
jgi:hypothetical protein